MRRQILQPLRTEVFKLQLDTLKTVQLLFAMKTELQLRRDVGLTDLVERNANRLVQDYAKVVFGRDYSFPTTDPMTWLWKPLNSSVQIEIQNRRWLSDKTISVDVREAFWNESYAVYGLEVPRAQSEALSNISQLSEHPLLPSDLTTPLRDYLSVIDDIAELLKERLGRCAKELREKRPTFESLDAIYNGENAHIWIMNSFIFAMGENRQLHPHAEKVLQAVRDNLRIENLHE